MDYIARVHSQDDVEMWKHWLILSIPREFLVATRRARVAIVVVSDGFAPRHTIAMPGHWVKPNIGLGTADERSWESIGGFQIARIMVFMVIAHNT